MRGWIIAHKGKGDGVEHAYHSESLSWASEDEAWDSWFLDNPLEEKGDHECVAVEVREVIAPEF